MKVIVICPKEKRDYLATHFIEGLYDNGVDVYATDFGNSVKTVYKDSEILDHSKSADYVFYIWGQGFSGKEYLVKQINRPEITAYIDGSEWTYRGKPSNPNQVRENIHRGEPWIYEEMFNYCRWYFKRECYPEDKDRGIIPFPFGCENSYFKDSSIEKKKWDVYLSFGHLGQGLRHDIHQTLNTEYYKDYSIRFNEPTDDTRRSCRKSSLDEYFDGISNSYICPSAWGGGIWCAREWEILANGSLCFMQKPIVLCPNKPLDGIHWVEYSDMNEFEEKLNYYLKDKELCLNIGRAGKEYALKYHSSKAKVKYALDIMSGG